MHDSTYSVDELAQQVATLNALVLRLSYALDARITTDGEVDDLPLARRVDAIEAWAAQRGEDEAMELMDIWSDIIDDDDALPNRDTWAPEAAHRVDIACRALGAVRTGEWDADNGHTLRLPDRLNTDDVDA